MTNSKEQCHICKKDMDIKDDPTSENLGGDCLKCMADIGQDPYAIRKMYCITGDLQYSPLSESLMQQFSSLSNEKIKNSCHNYLYQNVKTESRFIIDVSMFGTPHLLLNLQTLLFHANENEKILYVAPKAMFSTMNTPTTYFATQN